MEPLLKNKVALITGGTRGIGRALVKEFLSHGATVYFNYNKSAQEADELVDSLKKDGFSQVHALQCSVTDAAQIKALATKIMKEAGRIDVLVCNAGITRDNFLMTMQDDEWDQVIKTNLYGVFHTVRAVSRVMGVQKSGAIVNIASVAAIHGAKGQSNYSASKGGIIAFTKSAAIELIEKGIRVNCILPGFIETEMTYKMPSDIRKSFMAQIPTARMGKPEEIAYLASFLASERAGYIIGQSFVVDGGLTHGANG